MPDLSSTVAAFDAVMGGGEPPRPPADYAGPLGGTVAVFDAAMGTGWGNGAVAPETRVRSFVAAHAAAGSSHEEFDRQAQTYFPGADLGRLHQEFGLEGARRKAAGQEETDLQYAQRRMIPFASSGRAIGWELRVNRAREAHAKGQASPGDLDTIAQDEKQKAEDAAAQGGDYWTALRHSLASVPAVVGEMAAAGPFVKGATALAGRGAPSVLGRVGVTGAVVPALSPAMGFYQGAVRQAGQDGGSATDLKNAAPAFALSSINAMILGSVQQSLAGVANPFARIAGKGAIGTAEKLVADVGTSALGLQTGYGTIGKLLKTGDVKDAMQEASIDFITFSVFGALHRGQPAEKPGTALVPAGRPEPQALPPGPEPAGTTQPSWRPAGDLKDQFQTTFLRAVDHLKDQGYTREEAGKELVGLKTRLSLFLQINPDATPEQARAIFEKDAAGPVKDLGLAMADTFPAARPPGPRQLPVGTPDVKARVAGPGSPPAENENPVSPTVGDTPPQPPADPQGRIDFWTGRRNENYQRVQAAERAIEVERQRAKIGGRSMASRAAYEERTAAHAERDQIQGELDKARGEKLAGERDRPPEPPADNSEGPGTTPKQATEPTVPPPQVSTEAPPEPPAPALSRRERLGQLIAAAAGAKPHDTLAGPLHDLVKAAGLAGRVNDALSSDVRAALDYPSEQPGKGLRLIADHLPDQNALALNFEYADRNGGLTDRTMGMPHRAGITLLRDLVKIAERAKTAGLSITFKAEPGRAGLYGRGLAKAGYEKATEQAAPDELGMKEYVYKPAGRPAGSPPAAAPPGKPAAAPDPLSVLTAKDVAALARQVGVPAAGAPAAVFDLVRAAPGGPAAIDRLVRFKAKAGLTGGTAKPPPRAGGLNSPVDQVMPGEAGVAAGEKARAATEADALADETLTDQERAEHEAVAKFRTPDGVAAEAGPLIGRLAAEGGDRAMLLESARVAAYYEAWPELKKLWESRLVVETTPELLAEAERELARLTEEDQSEHDRIIADAERLGAEALRRARSQLHQAAVTADQLAAAGQGAAPRPLDQAPAGVPEAGGAGGPDPAAGPPPAAGGRPPAADQLTGGPTRVVTPTGAVPARYEVRDLSTVRASHQALEGGGIRSREKAGEYPAGLQPRDYAAGSGEHEKARRIARELEPAYLVSTHPDATSGPPTISPEGVVINGNGRQVGLEGAVHEGTYPAYKAELVKQAATFGLDPAAVEKMDRPALYRVVDMDPESAQAREFARAGNVAPTQSQSPTRTAASLGHLIDADVLKSLNLTGEATFSEIVTDPSGGRAFRRRLDAALPPTVRDQYFHADGRLTDAGTEFVRNMLLSKLLPAELIERMGEETKQVKKSVEGAIPQLLTMEREYPLYDLNSPLVEALDVLSRNPDIRSERDADNLLGQRSLFGGNAVEISPAGRMLLDFVLRDGMKPLVFRKKLSAVVHEIETGTRGLFADEKMDPTEAAAALGVTERPGAIFDRVRKAAADFLGDNRGAIDLGVLTDHFRQAARYVTDRLANLGGAIAPRLTRMSAASGNALARFVKAMAFVRQAAPLFAEKVLGDRWADAGYRRLMGATYAEARLRWMKDAFLDKSIEWDQAAIDARTRGDKAAESDAHAKAAEFRDKAKGVISVVGPDSALKTEADYQRVAAGPEFRQLLNRWRQVMVPEMEKNYRMAQGLDDTDPIHDFTQLPGLPINLKAVRKGDPVTPGTVFAGGSRGNLANTRQRRLGFAQQATGAAEGYETDLLAVIEHSLTHGHPRAMKAEFYRTLVREGVAVWGVRDVPLEGYRQLPNVDPQKGTQEAEGRQTSLYVKEEAYPEVRQALDVDEPANWMKATKAVNDVLTKASLASTVEAAYHAKNLLTFLAKPGVRPVRDFLPNLYRVLTGDRAARERLMELARIGATKDHTGFESGVLWGGKTDPTTWAGKFLDVVDRAARLTAEDAFTHLEGRTNPFTGKPLIESGEAAKRDFVNQLGQYTRAAQDKAVVWLRDTGFGPFATAATNYFVQGLRAVTGNPGVRATSTSGAVLLRAEALAKAVGLAGAALLTNYLLHRRVDGDDVTPLGAVKVGEKDGKTQYWDLGSFTGLTRGLRQTGLLAAIEGVHHHQPAAHVIDHAADDTWHALLHPAAGPGVGFAYTAKTGRNTLGTKIADKPAAESSESWENLKAALRNASPPFAQATGYSKPPGKYEQSHRLTDVEGRPAASVPAGERVQQFFGPFGIKSRTTRPEAAQAALEEQARQMRQRAR